MNQKNRDKIISIILLLIWCGLIFYFSNQNGITSEMSSSRILNFLNSIINIFGSKIDLNKSLIATFIVRKLAHIFLYFILYLICYYISISYKMKKKALFSFLFCLLYATSDEIHQLFIIERSFGVTDILIDLFGSLWGFIIIKLKINKN